MTCRLSRESKKCATINTHSHIIEAICVLRQQIMEVMYFESKMNDNQGDLHV